MEGSCHYFVHLFGHNREGFSFTYCAIASGVICFCSLWSFDVRVLVVYAHSDLSPHVYFRLASFYTSCLDLLVGMTFSN